MCSKFFNNKIYITLRNYNLIKVFVFLQYEPKLIQTISSFGVNPRDIDICNSGAYVANLDSDSLQYFYIDNEGLLTPSQNIINIKSPAFIKIKRC